MRWRQFLTRLGSAAVLGAVLMSEAATAADYELVQVVIVSRHGVRSPTNTKPPLATIAGNPWPFWPVPPGHLTPHGAELVTLLGTYYRDYYEARGLLPAQGCPQPSDVWTWTDVEQRTRLTAESLLKGMFPNCGLKPGYRAGAKVDPLFHPTRAGVCRIDPSRARQAVLQRIGGNFTSLLQTYQSELAAMQSVLKCCAPVLCRTSGRSSSCTLGELPNAIAAEQDGIRLTGPIAIGSTASEVFLLEYAQGFPENQVAWGRTSSPEAMRPLLKLHTLQFDLMQRTPYLAARQGSPLVQRVVETLRRTVNGAGHPDLNASTTVGRKLTLLVGHDTNLFNIGGMLGIHWKLSSYLPDQTPPAGALHFELLRDRQTGVYAVRVRYIAQTLDQMRQTARLDRDHLPEQVTATIDGCAATDDVCPWTAFEALATKALDRACVRPEIR